jgi:hypothetical protein
MSGQDKQSPPGTIVFVDVNVLPMDSEQILTKQTVVIQEGRILTMVPEDEIQVPADAHQIEANGAYLMPGLADMHTHLIEFDADPRHLILYLAHGVTTLRSLNSPWDTFKWQDRIKSGEWLGPSMYLSGPAIVGIPPDTGLLALGLRIVLGLIVVLASALVFGIIWVGTSLVLGPQAGDLFLSNLAAPWLVATFFLAVILVWRKILPLTRLAELVIPQAAVVETASQARAAVRRQVKAGVDFIKPYDYLNREIYSSTITTAKDYGVYTVGHIPDDPDVISVKEALITGQDEIVHMDEFTHEFWPNYDPKRRGKLDWEIDMSLIDKVADYVVDHDVAVTATLVTNEVVLFGLEDMESLLQEHEYQLIRPEMIENWRTKGRFIKWKGQDRYRREEWRPLLMKLTKALHDKGAILLLGTDVSVEGIIPGASAHKELELLVEAGLTPYEALCCGTRNAGIIAKRMGVDSDWGTIKVGPRANFILLEKNPFDEITNTRSQLGVMLRGKWLP